MKRWPIVQGEYRVANEPDVLISTLLGSCIAVCLRDGTARVGGMNHFLLSEPGPEAKLSTADMQRYGLHAMELLINELMKKGAQRSRLKAQVYGGANVVTGLGPIGSANAAFARRFLETEGIELGYCDVGGTRARKVEFMPFEGRARSTCVSDPLPAARAPMPAPATGDVELF